MVRHSLEHTQMQTHRLHTQTTKHKNKKDRDTALQTRLAHVSIGGAPIPILSQDEPLPGGYLGTALTASLCPKAHLEWTLEVLTTISKAVLTTPLPPNIKQRLLLYGANSKIMHTHCLMALSPTAITSIDSLLEATCRQIWRLPKGFPRAGLHAPHDKLGLNLPTTWEDYCAAATNSWITSSTTKEPSEQRHEPRSHKQPPNFNTAH
jgi:hypothetical protein